MTVAHRPMLLCARHAPHSLIRAYPMTEIRAHLNNTRGSVARSKFGRKAHGAGNSGDYCQATQHRARTFGAHPAGLGPVSRPIYQLGALLVVAIAPLGLLLAP